MCHHKLRCWTIGSVHKPNRCTCNECWGWSLVYTWCTRNTCRVVRAHRAASLPAPAGSCRGYDGGENEDPRGGAETHQNRIHQMSRTARGILSLFLSRGTMSHPLTTSGQRWSQMRLRPTIWGRKRIRLGTWAHVLSVSSFEEKEDGWKDGN